MYGEDKTSIEELKNTLTELQSLKIEILPKADKTEELNTSIEKMENQIKQVDENLLNDTQFVATSNETSVENVTEEEQQEITISEDSNLNILIANIDTLTEKVNQAVKVETKRKAEEERKAKELEEKKQYVGTYKNNDGQTKKITMNENGELYLEKYKIDINKKFKDGSIIIYDNSNDYVNSTCSLYPIGLSSFDMWDYKTNTTKAVDKNKIRILYVGSDVPEFNTNLYYKVD